MNNDNKFEQIEFNSLSDDNECFDIAYGIDKNFQLGASVSIVSVVINNPGINLRFHIFTDQCDSLFKDKIKNIVDTFCCKVSIYIIDSDSFSDYPSNEYWPKAVYFRFFAFQWLSNKIEKLLYLDADVVCNNNINELLTINFGEKIAAVSPDVERVRIKASKRFNNLTLSTSYFNSGVIYINLKKWKENDLYNKVMTTLKDPSLDLIFFDQDVLNLLFVNNLIFLDNKFNSIYSLDWQLKKRKSFIECVNDSTVFIHYAGITKPWNTWAIDNYAARPFKDVFSKSPWRKEEIFDAVTKKQKIKKSKHERKQGKYIKSIFTLLSIYLK